MIKQANPGRVVLSSLVAVSLLCLSGAGLAASLTIKEVKWEGGDKRLVVKGKGPRDARVTIENAGDRSVLGSTQTKDEGDGEWRFRKGLQVPPCRVRAEANGQSVERSVKNAGGNCDQGSAPPPNSAPVAVDDNASTARDAAIDIDVLANDSDADGDTLVISAVTQGTNGLASIVGSQLSYAPAADFIGSDNFSYTIGDGNGGSDSATVTVRVQATEPPPSIIGDSINSTSAGTDFALDKVLEQGLINPGGHTLLVANDLGMHCADLDYRVFSILPPFNVMHAQVIERGNGAGPRILDDTDVELVYSATSSANDPANDNATADDRGEPVFKSNFWTTLSGDANPLWYEVYSPLYFGLLQAGDLDQDKGLPVPDSMKLAGNGQEESCLADYLAAAEGPEGPRAKCDLAQALMPGYLNPYDVNDLQHFDRFDHDFNFFNGLLGGLGLGAVVPGTNWFSAEGIAILPVDDQGRSNAYPLMRVQARSKSTGQVLASTDVVLPVASEADCQQCHARTLDCETVNQTYGYDMQCSEEALDRPHPEIQGYQAPVVASLDDEVEVPPGDTQEQQLLNAAKINILRLHDAKWDTALDTKRRVVCASCHYSPALDLTQLGPTDSANTEQTQHISMSRAMHGHHGQLMDKANRATLFPEMPAPNDPIRDQPVSDHLDAYPLAAADSPFTVEEYVLQNACYSCHPGKRTQCLRGAMGGGGVVCQDCHGDMLAVGDDFSHDFPNTAGNMDTSKRVPWAVEPGCQSCHVGDAVNQPSNTTGFVYADDNIRLLQAYLANDDNATPIKAAESRFAENRVVNDQGQTVDLLYRLSKGHGGVMCQGCHGSTHAVWPNANPWANDNVTATQIQGHAGTITECAACHEGGLGLTLDGPHGMHPVADRNWNKEHEEMSEGNSGACKSCHGDNGQGTVLSRTAAERVWECKDDKGTLCNSEDQMITVAKGTRVSCTQCHENEINHD